MQAQDAIKWRFQTYAGAALGEHVTKPVIDYINTAANGEMEIELFYADQIVPTGELCSKHYKGVPLMLSIRTMTRWRRRLHYSMFGGYFPLATKHALDVPVLFNQYGLADIWRTEYAKVGVAWLSAAGQDPCNFNTKKEITFD